VLRAARGRASCTAGWSKRLSAFRFPFSFVRCQCEPRFFSSSLPGLTRQSMRKRSAIKFRVASRKPQVSMDHRVKPGGDEGGLLRAIKASRRANK
jgi:hypothetical protein